MRRDMVQPATVSAVAGAFLNPHHRISRLRFA